jgi:hypothetical protein
MYETIKNFLAIVNRGVQRKDKQVKLSIEDAVKMQTEISMLLLELKNSTKTETNSTYDGGKF